MNQTLKIKNLYEIDYIEKLTKYAHEDDAGIDLISRVECILLPKSCVLIPTGIAIELPWGYFGLIRSRSGLAVYESIGMLSSGIIDQGYRGEIMVNLINHSAFNYDIYEKNSIAQLVVLPYSKVNLEWLDTLSSTDRGEKGHGSTGI